MDFAEMTCMGLVLTSFGAAMREPVTMISCRGVESSGVGGACCAEPGTAWAIKVLWDARVLACGAPGSAAIALPVRTDSEAPATSDREGSLSRMTVTVFSSR